MAASSVSASLRVRGKGRQSLQERRGVLSPRERERTSARGEPSLHEPSTAKRSQSPPRPQGWCFGLAGDPSGVVKSRNQFYGSQPAVYCIQFFFFTNRTEEKYHNISSVIRVSIVS